MTLTSNGSSGSLLHTDEPARSDQAIPEVERRRTQQLVLAEITALALSQERFPSVLQTIAQLLTRALPTPFTKVLQFADRADHLILVAGCGWQDGLVGNGTVGIERASQAGYTLLDPKPVVVADLRTETRFDGPQLLHDHGVRSGMSCVISGAGERPFGVLGVHTDAHEAFDEADVAFLVAVANAIAARARLESAQDHRKVLLREMAHRAGNLLQLANSLFLNTLRHTVDLEEAKRSYSQRLSAMARANMMIVSAGLEKAGLRALARDSLEAHAGQVAFKGRDILLPADLCFDISLLWHEIAANSLKYGSFSGRDGRVEIAWQVRQVSDALCQLTLIWEDGLPNRIPVPSRTGFGTKLMSRIVEQKYRGAIEITTDPRFRCVITLNFALSPV